MEDFVHVVPELMSRLASDPENVLTTIENALREVQQLIFNELDFPVRERGQLFTPFTLSDTHFYFYVEPSIRCT